MLSLLQSISSLISLSYHFLVICLFCMIVSNDVVDRHHNYTEKNSTSVTNMKSRQTGGAYFQVRAKHGILPHST